MPGLETTVEGMMHEDYKERFKAEYYQLRIRMNSLQKMLSQYVHKTLTWDPDCSYNTLNRQLQTMMIYSQILESRAQEEQIELPKMKGDMITC